MSNNKFIDRSKSEQKKELILNTATALFTENGYASISMDLVAKEVGVSKQTIYSHFGNKDELYIEAISSKCESYQMFDLLTEKITDLLNLLIDISTRFIEMITSKEAMAVHRICSYEYENYPQLSQRYYDAGPHKVIKEMEKLMAKLSNEGHLSISNVRFAALQFMHLLKGELWMQVEFNTSSRISESDNKQYINETVDMFMRAYAR